MTNLENQILILVYLPIWTIVSLLNLIKTFNNKTYNNVRNIYTINIESIRNIFKFNIEKIVKTSATSIFTD